MDEAELAFFAPFLIENRSRGGRRPQDHRKVLDGIFWITRTGSAWRDLPAEFGNRNSVQRQYRRSKEAGIWDVMVAALAESDAADTNMQMIDSTIVRAHQHAAGGKRGIHRNAIGPSRGGLTTKLHTRTDAQGRAIGFCLTPGQASGMAAYGDLMQEEAPDPAAMLADKGYDSDDIRDDLERRGAGPVIPTKSNRRVQRPVDKATYGLRNRIERFFDRFKHSRRTATRYDKLASSFLGFVQLATIRRWIRFVRAT
ncbi:MULTISPECIES: IS5 family transposase [unclassified Mesorhizobium]|uniref:IS5 family transposase n=1 Tax=unclassified Mesorhizobium TaxID=325217 RepID=UPI001CD0C72B|nr:MULTISPECIES: IS5 family transposase [unclassified Mesorhizobium]MBZ9894288.1 IS5 family transposase [Mesorhizobium sp. BR1-1-6]